MWQLTEKTMTKTILLADDSKDDTTAIQMTLGVAGVKNRVVTVTDGDETIAYLKGDEPFSDRDKFPFPDVLLLDLRMPRIDGFQVLEWLKTEGKFKNLFVIVLSGISEVHSIRMAYALGANSFFIKPCSVDDIKNSVKAHPQYWQS
jgi:CheY-like chemotaxis protein